MTARIPARSKRQAMDWGLALMSQGIEPAINVSDEAGWELAVEEHEYLRALDIIRLYHAENLHWPWRRKVLRREFLFDWGALAWVFLIALFFWLTEKAPGLHDAGLMEGKAVAHGEWWRLFTAIFLHADLAHLLSNAVIGLILLGLAMGIYGTGVGLLAALLAGAGGNLIAWLVDNSHRSLGASGMVMGALGLLAAQSVTARRNPRRLKVILSGLAAGIMLLVLLGTSPNSDVVAHFGGFVCGALLGGILMLPRRITNNTTANIFAGAAFCLLVILAWWLALNAGKI